MNQNFMKEKRNRVDRKRMLHDFFYAQTLVEYQERL